MWTEETMLLRTIEQLVRMFGIGSEWITLRELGNELQNH